MSTRFVIPCKLHLSKLPLLRPSCQPAITTWRSRDDLWIKELYSFTSSANSFVCTDVSKRILSISFMNKRNRMGPRTLPCGTPLVICIQSQKYNQRYLQPESYLTKMLSATLTFYSRFRSLPICLSIFGGRLNQRLFENQHTLCNNNISH